MVRCRSTFLIGVMMGLLATACASSVVVGQDVPAIAQEPVVAEAPSSSAAAADTQATAVRYTDDLGDWYVPAPTATELVRPLDLDRAADEVVAEINAAVPTEYDLSFEWQLLTLDEGHTAQALIPQQWEQRDDRFEYDYAALDFFTNYEIDSGCQGFCVAQQWELLMADPESSPFRVLADVGIEVLVDQPLTDPPGRLLVLDRSAVPTGGMSVSVEVVRWSNDADRFLNCEAALGESDRSLWPTFADACLAAVGDWLS